MPASDKPVYRLAALLLLTIGAACAARDAAGQDPSAAARCSDVPDFYLIGEGCDGCQRFRGFGVLGANRLVLERQGWR